MVVMTLAEIKSDMRFIDREIKKPTPKTWTREMVQEHIAALEDEYRRLQSRISEEIYVGGENDQAQDRMDLKAYEAATVVGEDASMDASAAAWAEVKAEVRKPISDEQVR